MHLKTGSLRLQRALIFFIQLGILSSISCHSELGEKNGDTKTETQQLQRQLAGLKRMEKGLQQENKLARKSDPYLLAHLADGSMELKAKGRVLRTFKVKGVKASLEAIPDAAQVIAEVKPIQKTDRPKIKPGEGDEATSEAIQKNLWGLHRMPQDFDLVCRSGMILEIRALPSEQTGIAPVKFLKTIYRRTLDWYRHEKSSDQTPTQTIQMWLDEDDARLLFWSLPKQLNILIIQT